MLAPAILAAWVIIAAPFNGLDGPVWDAPVTEWERLPARRLDAHLKKSPGATFKNKQECVGYIKKEIKRAYNAGTELWCDDMDVCARCIDAAEFRRIQEKGQPQTLGEIPAEHIYPPAKHRP